MNDTKIITHIESPALTIGARPRRARRSRAATLPPAPAVAEPRLGTIWFDYTDLVHYFEGNRMPTGIQRVQIGLFRASLGREADSSAGRIAACSFDTHRRCWIAVPDVLLASVCRAACQPASSGPGGDDETWRSLTATLHQSVATGAPAPFAPGDMLVNIGSSWWIPDYLRYVNHLQRERGVSYVAFVHDCIPLRVPETCSANLVDEFRTWFGETMRLADLVLANSAHTARDIALLGPEQCGQPVTAHVVHLDARFDEGPQLGAASASRLDATTRATLGIRRPFALFVATLEARKNHQFVFECWAELIERHGDAVPDLLCVGKQGWLFDYTMNWLRVHPHLADRVRLLGTVSDHDLAALYRTSQFTVYCSKYEGWGLPVTESLCHGKVPVVPEHTSLPEAGGAFAAYYEPGSQQAFCSQVERLMDQDTRQELEARIRARYRPRAWTGVLEQLVSTVRRAPVREVAAAAAVEIQPGTIYGMGRPQPSAQVECGDRLRHGIGWHAAEDWGGWSRMLQAQLLFALPARVRDTMIYLLLRGGPAEQVVHIQAAGRALAPVLLNPGQRRLVRIPLDRAAAGAELMISFNAVPYSLATYTGGGDPREIGFGLEALAVADRRDAASRIEILECFLAPA